MASHFALKPPSRSAIKAFFHPLNIHCVNQRGNTLQISLSHQPGAYSAIKIAHQFVQSWPHMQVSLTMPDNNAPFTYTGSRHPRNWAAHSSLSGQDVIVLMRAYGITIRTLARKMNITQTRIRAVRNAGLQNPAHIRDWLEAITSPDKAPSLTCQSTLHHTQECHHGS